MRTDANGRRSDRYCSSCALRRNLGFIGPLFEVQKPLPMLSLPALDQSGRGEVLPCIQQANLPSVAIAVKVTVSAGRRMWSALSASCRTRMRGRTFVITCMLGTLSSLIGLPYAITGFARCHRNSYGSEHAQPDLRESAWNHDGNGIGFDGRAWHSHRTWSSLYSGCRSYRDHHASFNEGTVLLPLIGVRLCRTGSWTAESYQSSRAWIRVIVVAAIAFMNYIFLSVYRHGIYYALWRDLVSSPRGTPDGDLSFGSIHFGIPTPSVNWKTGVAQSHLVAYQESQFHNHSILENMVVCLRASVKAIQSC